MELSPDETHHLTMRFTVVTPSFNQLDWLARCIASVRDQVAQASDECRVTSDETVGRGETGNLKPEEMRARISVEHIVQDAGTPGIEDLARRHGAAFYREGTKVFSAQETGDGRQGTGLHSLTIYSGKDGGMYDAINRGLGKATGEVCSYLNCDEQYLPGTLPWVADFFAAAPGTDVLFGAAIVVREDGSYVCDRRVIVPTRWHTMVSGNLSIFTSSTFFRRGSVVDRGLVFDPQWKVVGDAAWALRLIGTGAVMASTHRPLSAFAETGSNLSAGGNPEAAVEVRRLAQSAPRLARCLRPWILFCYRLRRWRSGAYRLHPHRYAIYADAECRSRRSFDVSRPSFRWKLEAS